MKRSSQAIAGTLGSLFSVLVAPDSALSNGDEIGRTQRIFGDLNVTFIDVHAKNPTNTQNFSVAARVCDPNNDSATVFLYKWDQKRLKDLYSQFGSGAILYVEESAQKGISFLVIDQEGTLHDLRDRATRQKVLQGDVNEGVAPGSASFKKAEAALADGCQLKF